MSLAIRERVSALIPVRNEAEDIAQAVRSLAAQPEVIEIIVADDDSSDCTPGILDDLQSEVPHLRVVKVGDPPKGWLGKSHALTVASREASGNWLLFTNADTVHQPGSLGHLLERAQRDHVDLLTLSPGQQTPTWWEKAVIPFVFVELARRFRFDEVSNPKSKIAAANGQYLLIRRTVYDLAGGHEALHEEILDDVALARRVKSLGRRILFLPGAQWVSTRMYRHFRAMWRAWQKNLYLLWGGSPFPPLFAVTRIWLLDLAPPLGFLLGLGLLAGGGGLEAAFIAAGCLALTVARRVTYGHAVTRLGYAPGIANYGIPGAAIFWALMLASLATHRWLGSVRWKGRTYSANGSPGRSPGQSTTP
ncbi:MAG TPA: glycosyltransferase family 2 protein [Terriglobia bacterium]|nr:glycosyltransferase family 2 protein [Terriglobia bacterium]